MKKKLLFSLSFALCTVLSAQVIPPVSKSMKLSITENNDFILVQQYDLVWDNSDSIWKHTRNATYKYNNFNNPVEKFESWTDGSGPYKMTVCEYDANQNLDLEWVYVYSDSEWVNSAKTLYDYDENNNRIQKTMLVWDGTQFENQIKNTYSYDANNKKTYQMMYYWDDVWEESQQFDFQYDGSGFLYKMLSEILIENAWINHQKSIFTYDTISGNLMDIKVSNWDLELSQWTVPQIQQNYTYNQDNNRIIFVIQTWDEFGEKWYNLYKTDYYYLATDSEEFEYHRSNLDKSIDDFQSTHDELIVGPATRENQELTLSGVEVLIDSVMHTSVGDLEFTLTHNGISSTIIYHAGGDGDNFSGTKLSDRGVESISSGMAPFYGIYRPESPLSVFLETDPAGVWTLSIYDGAEGNTGVLHSWGLNLIYSSGSSSKYDNFVNEPGLLLFPNPATDIINLQPFIPAGSSAFVEIFGLNGRKLLEKYINTGNEICLKNTFKQEMKLLKLM